MIKDKPYKKVCEKWGRIQYDPVRGYLFEYKPYDDPLYVPQSLMSILMPYLDKCDGKDIIISIKESK